METPAPDNLDEKSKGRVYLESFIKQWKDILALITFSTVIVAIDQWTKSWVRETVPLWSERTIGTLDWLTPYARIRHVYNTGAAFGIFEQGGWFFAVLAVIVSLLIISYYPSTSRQDWWLRLALGFQLGGAFGNLLDRIIYGGVTDFISLGSFAIFNVADSCITIGVAILIIGVWWTERKKKKGDAIINE